MTADKVIGDPSARLGVNGGASDIKIVVEIELWGEGVPVKMASLGFQRTRCIMPRASSDHKLNVSISLAAHTPFRVPLPPPIQPVCEILLPRLPTCNTASSSSDSSAFDIDTSPSVDPDSRRLRDRSEDREKLTAVMSSEWVEVCFLSGAEGCRGSLHICLFRASEHRAVRQSERTNIGQARRPVEVLSRPRQLNHPKIRRRKGDVSVSLQTALWDIVVSHSVAMTSTLTPSRTLHVLSIAAAPVRSSHTRTTPSFPDEIITL
jgi:hypothetical protein